jgi:hypothetical protein
MAVAAEHKDCFAAVKLRDLSFVIIKNPITALPFQEKTAVI